MAHRSLRLQLLLWLLIPLAGAVVANTWVTYRNAQDTAGIVTDRTLLASARSIAERVQVNGGAVDVTIPPAALEMFETGFHDRVYYRIMRLDGATDVALIAGNADLPRPRDTVQPLMSVFYDADYRGEPLRLVAIRQPLLGGGQATALIVIGETLVARGDMATGLWVRSLLQQSLLVLIVAVFVWFGLERGLRPLLRLREAVLERAPDELRPFSAEALQSELQPLVAALNQYIERLRRQIEAQRRFVANAAHQLRTPLTILATQAGYAIRSRNPAEKDEALEAIHGHARDMARLAHQLLTLSNVEPDGRARRRDRVDLVAVARRALESQVSHALGRDMDLGFDPKVSEAPMPGDATLLHELIVNLVDNALRYTPRNGVVTVGIEDVGSDWLLTVRDDGPGIPEAERGRVFERFYRVLGNEAEGSGLGLAIAKEIVDGAGGTIALADAGTTGGLLVSVRLPKAA
ncbi:MAG TPA: sensor histidine kinase [Candidatus Binatia bacterium]|nr:sensor histidine kinase [Candidatus Binatia bacterium]